MMIMMVLRMIIMQIQGENDGDASPGDFINLFDFLDSTWSQEYIFLQIKFHTIDSDTHFSNQFLSFKINFPYI